jgi:hypothetical protein
MFQRKSTYGRRGRLPFGTTKEATGEYGYGGHFFRQYFPVYARQHPCDRHVVGMLFVNAGLADSNGSRYWFSP